MIELLPADKHSRRVAAHLQPGLRHREDEHQYQCICTDQEDMRRILPGLGGAIRLLEIHVPNNTMSDDKVLLPKTLPCL